MQSNSQVLALALALAVGLAACDNEETMPPPEPTMFRVRVENVTSVHDFPASGAFTVPDGASEPGPLLPGDAYEAEFAAAPGARLSFATMFVESNDFFYAPDEQGIALFDDGTPVSGDVTAQVLLWDAGTEINQEPGLGPDQVTRQASPNTGDLDETTMVRIAPDDFDNLPAVAEVIRVTLEPVAGNRFTLKIENVSTESTLPTSGGGEGPVPLSPGAWVVHTSPAPLFTQGEPDRGVGLEAIAEDGDAAPLAAHLADRTGLTTPLSPGAYAVHADGMPLFTDGQPERGDGLEAIAEDGDPAELGASLAARSELVDAGTFSIPLGGSQAGAIPPGGAYEFTIMAEPGQRLSLATMFVQSNDLFYAPADDGLALFVGDLPSEGDVTGEFRLWDAGTEVNEVPGAGPNQVQRQTGPNQGAAEDGTVQPVSDGFDYPATSEVMRVTLSPEG